MGFNDHRKYWFIELTATADACAAAFADAFSKQAGRIGRKGKFSIEVLDTEDDTHRLVARYLGRGGVAGIAAAVSNSSTQLENSAKGSGIALSISPSSTSSDKVECQVWLQNWSSAVGPLGTADVGILRPYLQDARDRISQLDRNARVWSQK